MAGGAETGTGGGAGLGSFALAWLACAATASGSIMSATMRAVALAKPWQVAASMVRWPLLVPDWVSSVTCQSARRSTVAFTARSWRTRARAAPPRRLSISACTRAAVGQPAGASHWNAKLAGACARAADGASSPANPSSKPNDPMCALARIDRPLIAQRADAGIWELLQSSA
jgi:hypothetical protein